MNGRDPTVLSSPVAVELLTSRIPARIGYLTTSGEVHVVPMWFHWDGTDMVIATFDRSHKLRHVRTGHRIAATVDTEAFPYQALQIRGTVTVTPTTGSCRSIWWRPSGTSAMPRAQPLSQESAHAR